MGIRQNLEQLGIEDRTYTVEEWLKIEERTGEKFEFHEGRLVSWQMMAGGSVDHAAISGNLVYLFGKGVREASHQSKADKSCRVFTSDLQLSIVKEGRYVYPDAAVVCGQVQYDSLVSSAVTNPVVIAEILSPSSIRYDMGLKFDYYSRLKSLREYIIVAQDEYAVEIRSRTSADGKWTFNFYEGLEAHAVISSLNIKLPLTDIYRGIEFPEDIADKLVKKKSV